MNASLPPFDPAVPFNALPLLPPRNELETRPVLKKAIAANKALAELKGVGDLIPDQSVLIQTIGLQEAKLSSEIENIVTTNDDLYRAFGDEGQKADPNTKEVLRYQEALWYGYSDVRSGRPLATNLFIEMYRIIKMTSAGIRKTPGTKLADGKGNVIYTPPEGEAVLRDKLANLEKFIHAEDDLDPLVRMAVETREKILAIRNLMQESGERFKKELPKVYSKELLELLFRLPYAKIRFLEEAGIARRKTASRYLQELAASGFLHPVKGGREIYYLNKPFLNLLTS